jgi:hypothetical protein
MFFFQEASSLAIATVIFPHKIYARKVKTPRKGKTNIEV